MINLQRPDCEETSLPQAALGIFGEKERASLDALARGSIGEIGAVRVIGAIGAGDCVKREVTEAASGRAI